MRWKHEKNYLLKFTELMYFVNINNVIFSIPRLATMTLTMNYIIPTICSAIIFGFYTRNVIQYHFYLIYIKCVNYIIDKKHFKGINIQSQSNSFYSWIFRLFLIQLINNIIKQTRPISSAKMLRWLMKTVIIYKKYEFE